MQALARAVTPERARLVSGLILLAYVTCHLINHAFGLISLRAMVEALEWIGFLWETPVGLTALYGALVVHVALVIRRLWRRRSLAMPFWEAAQTGLGFLIPPLIALHLIASRGAEQLFDSGSGYPFALIGLWPDLAVRQSALVLVVWIHGVLGLHFWLRLKPWYGRVKGPALGVAVILPVLALLGFVNGGRELQAALAARPELVERLAARDNWPNAEEVAWIYAAADRAVIGYCLFIGGFGLARLARRRFARGGARTAVVRYPSGLAQSLEPGMTVLEASRAVGAPHVAVCGGRARCSTCRVRVGAGRERLPTPEAAEARLLERLKLGPHVRLGCQLRPIADVEVTPLTPAREATRTVNASGDPNLGAEREIAVMFADLRAFTRLAEGRLPFDTVYLLNQYFAAMTEEIVKAGGRVDKYMGDGLMALFGLKTDGDAAARQAIDAARAMGGRLEELNARLGPELEAPLRVAIGAHIGAVIVGRIGQGDAARLTAIGDAVNVASRLEGAAKLHDAEFVTSQELLARAGRAYGNARLEEITVRNREAPLTVAIYARAEAAPA